MSKSFKKSTFERNLLWDYFQTSESYPKTFKGIRKKKEVLSCVNNNSLTFALNTPNSTPLKTSYPLKL